MLVSVAMFSNVHGCGSSSPWIVGALGMVGVVWAVSRHPLFLDWWRGSRNKPPQQSKLYGPDGRPI